MVCVCVLDIITHCMHENISSGRLLGERERERDREGGREGKSRERERRRENRVASVWMRRRRYIDQTVILHKPGLVRVGIVFFFFGNRRGEKVLTEHFVVILIISVAEGVKSYQSAPRKSSSAVCWVNNKMIKWKITAISRVACERKRLGDKREGDT